MAKREMSGIKNDGQTFAVNQGVAGAPARQFVRHGNADEIHYSVQDNGVITNAGPLLLLSISEL